jgi:hypothetical protein
MTPDAPARADDRRLTPAKARLCALLPRLSEREVEALLGIAEVLLCGMDRRALALFAGQAG